MDRITSKDTRVKRGQQPLWFVTVPLTIGALALLLVGQATGSFRHRALMPAAPAQAQTVENNVSGLSGQVVDGQLFSEAVGEYLHYRVYLPPGYDSHPSVHYPVLYLLHGLGGSYLEWWTDGALAEADQMIGTNQIAPLMIVLPEGEGAYWVDHANGGPRWGAYVAQDLVSTIDGQYRTMPDRAHRAIGGMSMGGNGALQLAMNHPDVFSVVGAHSFALRRHDTAPSYFGDQAYFNAHDPVYLFQNRPDVARTLKLWLDVGAGDPWRPADEAFDQQLTGEEIEHVWHEYTGAHEDAYWSAHVSDYLRFYAAALSSAG